MLYKPSQFWSMMIKKIHRIHLIYHLLKNSNRGLPRVALEFRGWYKLFFTISLGHTSVNANFTFLEWPEGLSLPEPFSFIFY